MSKKNLTVFIVLSLIVTSIPFDEVIVFGQESEPVCRINEYFEYSCDYSFEKGIFEVFLSHTLNLDIYHLEPQNKAIEITLFTLEKPIRITQFPNNNNNIFNETSKDNILIRLETEEESVTINISLNNTEQFFDPLDIASLPFGVPLHPQDEYGNLNFELWVNNTQFLDSCSFGSDAYQNVRNLNLVNSDLKFQSSDREYYRSIFSMNNVSAGYGQVTFQASTTQLSNYLRFQVTATKNSKQTPIICKINDEHVDTNNSVNAIYNLYNYKFSLQDNPFYFYGPEAIYLLNFTTPYPSTNFSLRLPITSSRERIDALQFEKMPTNFSVTPVEYLGEPCYSFEFQFDNTTDCNMTLSLKTIEWFIDAQDLTLEDVPDSVAEVYLNPYSSVDGYLFDVNDEFVQNWADEIVGNETNPYIIATNIYENLTNTIDGFPENWKELNENKEFNENVHGILELKLGVCRHFAVAYASLCICSGIPARTVTGTSFGNLVEFEKKHHEWTEIYIPGYNWVTVDASWNQSFMLDNRHAKAFFSNYISETMNVTDVNSTINYKMSIDSIVTLNNIIDLCKSLTHGNVDSEILLDKASFYVKNLKIHEALLCVAEAYLEVANANAMRIEEKNGMINFISFSFQIGGIFVVVSSQVFFIINSRKKYGSVKKAFLSFHTFPEINISADSEPNKELKKMDEQEAEKRLKKFPLAKMLLDDFKISLLGIIFTLIGLVVGIF